MAEKSILKAVAGSTVGSAYARVAENMPNPTRGLYNLGLGIGPAIQAAANNFGKSSTTPNDDKRDTRDSIQAASKTAAQGYKSVAAALSSMNRILDDIRKINVAQLTLQSRTLSQQQIQKNKQAYTDIESMLETMRPNVSGTTRKELADKKESGGMLSSVFGGFLSSGLGTKLGLGALALIGLANADKIKEFTKTFLTAAGYDPNTIQQKVETYLKDTAKDIGRFAVDTVKAAVSEVGKLLITGITSQKQQILDAYKVGSGDGSVLSGIQEANRKVIAPDIGGVGGFVAGFRMTPGGVLSKTAGGTVGAIAGTAFAEENPELLTGAAVLGTGYYGYSKYKKFKNAGNPKVAPTMGAGGSEPPKGPYANVDKMSPAERRALIRKLNTAEKSNPGFKKVVQAMFDGVKKNGSKFITKLTARLGPRAAAASAPILSQVAVPGWGEIVAIVVAIVAAGFTIYEIYNIIQESGMDDYDNMFPKNQQNMPGKSQEDFAIEEIISKSENKAPVTSLDYGPSARDVANQVAGVTPVTPLSLTSPTQTPFDENSYMAMVGNRESGGDYGSSTSLPGQTASGKYGFTKGTFETMKSSAPSTAKLKYASWDEFKGSPQLQDYAMQQLTRLHYEQMSNALGRAPTQEEMYLAHFLGLGGALAVINNTNSDAPIRDILAAGGYGKNGNPSPEAVIANNKALFNNVGTAKDLLASVSSFYHGGKAGGSGSPTGSTIMASAAPLKSSLFTPEQMEAMGISQEDVTALESLQTQVSGMKDIAGQVLSVITGSGSAQAAPAASRSAPETITALPPSAPEKDRLTGYINGFALKSASSFR
jgi:hypothetical protein